MRFDRVALSLVKILIMSGLRPRVNPNPVPRISNERESPPALVRLFYYEPIGDDRKSGLNGSPRVRGTIRCRFSPGVSISAAVARRGIGSISIC